MGHAIKVDSQFATAYDTARILGVPKSRTDELVRRVRRLTDRIVHRKSRSGEVTGTGPIKKIAAKKTSGRYAGTGAQKTKTKAKSARASG
jgi:hypothetical protein